MSTARLRRPDPAFKSCALMDQSPTFFFTPLYTVHLGRNASLLVMAAGKTSLLPNVVTQSTQRAAAPVLVGIWRLLSIPQFRVVILVSALVYGSHAMHDTFAVIRWSLLEYSQR